MGIRAHHVATSLFVGTILLTTAAWFSLQAPAAEAACGTGSSVVITGFNSTTANPPLSGIRTLEAYSTPTAASGISFTLMGPALTPLGEATQTNNIWRLQWDSRNVPNGAYQLIAIAHFGTATTLDCASPTVSVQIFNQPTQAPTLAATIIPGTWQGNVGQSSTFTLNTTYTDQYGRRLYISPESPNLPTWHTTLGNISKTSEPGIILQAGATAGNGTLVADVSYQGLTAHATAQIKVLPLATASNQPTTATPTPTLSPTTSAPGTTTTTSDAARLATMPTIFRPATVTNANPTVGIPTLSCLEKKIGQAKFDTISSGQAQPTTAERRLAAECFSHAEPIPAILAPVAPAHVDELEEVHDLVSVSQIKNTTITNAEGKKISSLLLTGKGVPNTNIFIYVFSDPLVLRAQTDSQGAWSYILENPLEPGNHEVYAVAEKDATSFVRTAAIPISIAAAAPDGQDGNLIIERHWSAAQIGFIALAVLLVLAAIGVIITLMRRRRNNAALITTPTSAPLIQPASTPVAVSPELSPALPTAPPTPPATPPATPTAPSTPAAPPNNPKP